MAGVEIAGGKYSIRLEVMEDSWKTTEGDSSIIISVFVRRDLDVGRRILR